MLPYKHACHYITGDNATYVEGDSYVYIFNDDVTITDDDHPTYVI